MRNERYLRVSKKIKESIVPFAVLFSLFVFLAWLIVKPLGGPLLWSAVLSYFAYPFYKGMYRKLFNGRYANIAAGVTTASILIFMAIPMLIMGLFLTKESFRIYEAVIESGILNDSYSEIMTKLQTIPYVGKWVYHFNALSGMPVLEVIINSSLNWVTAFLKVLSREMLGNAFKIFYLLAIVTISSFFFVRDGHLILNYIRELMPLTDEARDSIIDRSEKMLRAVVYGIVFTASVQGTLGGLGWWYVGLPHPLFFGFFMFITGMIPFVGTPVIWIPGSITLFLNGEFTGGMMLLAWGFGVVSMVDNFIRPIFISEESKIHMLIIFIGIFGGLFNWGFLGLFIGPLILSLGIFILDLYRAIATESIGLRDNKFE